MATSSSVARVSPDDPAMKRAFVCTAVVVVLAILWWLRPSATAVRQQPADEPSSASSEFALEDVAERWGVSFRYDPGDPTYLLAEIVCGGAAVFDANGDGKLDVLLRGSAPGRGHRHAQKAPTSRLFVQQADGRFRDATVESGLLDDGYTMGVAVGDVNNDGLPDLYFANYRSGRLYVNLGGGRFADATPSANTANDGFGSSACFVDFDRDGRLDLFVVNYCDLPEAVRVCRLPSGEADYCHPRVFAGSPAKLFRNDTPAGAGPTGVRFVDVSEKSGVAGARGRGLGVLPTDVDGDGWPDLFVANDLEPNFLWRNRRDGTFEQAGARLCVSVASDGAPQSSMGVAETDVDGDGRFDILVTNFEKEYTTLYLRTDFGFADRSGKWKLTTLTRPFTGFGVVTLDLDGDGREEIIQTNGRVSQSTEKPVVPPTDPQKDPAGLERFWQAYAQRGLVLSSDGKGFRDVSAEAGDFGRRLVVGRSLALGDLDGDGFPEVVCGHAFGPAAIYRKTTPIRGHYLRVRAVDPQKGGRDALGALVRIKVGERTLAKRLQTAGTYLSANEPVVHFGLGNTDRIDEIAVQWPDGDLRWEAFPGGATDRTVTLERGKGRR